MLTKLSMTPFLNIAVFSQTFPFFILSFPVLFWLKTISSVIITIPNMEVKIKHVASAASVDEGDVLFKLSSRGVGGRGEIPHPM